MGWVLRCVFAFGVVPLLASCWAGIDGGAARVTSGAQAATADVYPRGIVTSDRAKRAIQGVYPSAGESCCWISGDARFVVASVPNAKVLRFTVYEPAVPSFVKSPPSLVVLDATGKPRGAHRIAPGLQSFALPLPGAQTGPDGVLVRLHVSRTFVPKNEGMTADDRHLAVVLRDVAVQ